MKDFLKGMFSAESNISFGRVGAAAALLTCLAWDSYSVFIHNTYPDLYQQAVFISAVYGISKAGETIQTLKGGK